MSSSLLRRAGQAVALNALANWITMIGSFVSLIIIARILTPEDYGIYVAALVAISLPEIIATGSLGDALIQHKDLRKGHVNSIFLQSMVLAAGFWLVLILLAPFIARQAGHSNVAPVLIVCGSMLPIGAMMSVPASLLNRDLRYKEITFVDVLGTVVSGVVGIVLAILWRNEWALVVMELSRRVVRLVAFMIFAKWIPSIEFHWNDMRELGRFNLFNGVSRILQTVDTVLPRTIVGATLGPASLGIFNLAERLVDQAKSALVNPFASIALPIAAMVQADRPALIRAMENAIRMSSFLANPTFIGGFVVAPFAIPLVLGEQWIPSIPIIQIYMIISLRSPMTAIIAGVLRGVGRPDTVIFLTAASIILTFILVGCVYQYGLYAIALALLAKMVITFFLSTWAIQRVVGFSIIRQMQAGATSFFASCIMGGIVWLALTYLPDPGNPLLHLAELVLIGVAAYFFALLALAPRLGLRTIKAARVLVSGHPKEAIQMIRTALQEQGA